VPAQQVDPLIPWLTQHTGAKKFYLPSADYIWPRVLNRRVCEVVAANGGTILGEEYFPLDHADYSATIEKIMSGGTELVFNMTVPPGLTPFLEQPYNAGFTRRGGRIVCTYFDENLVNMLLPPHVEGLYSCLDYYQTIDDAFSRTLLARYNARNQGAEQFTGGSACSGLYRGMKLWEVAVREAGTIVQEDVIEALDHARIAEGPGGGAEMVPGQHHVRMNMYIAQVVDGSLRIVKSLGAINPNERVLPAAQKEKILAI
jgi:urea transport system substrate-binding protein